jgi:hypothetical protein
MPTKSRKPETIALHAGYRSDPATGASYRVIRDERGHWGRVDRRKSRFDGPDGLPGARAVSVNRRPFLAVPNRRKQTEVHCSNSDDVVARHYGGQRTDIERHRQ